MNNPVFYRPGQMHIQEMASAETLLSCIHQKSIEDYHEEFPDMLCIEYQDAAKQMSEAAHNAYIEPKATAITEERWFEMLNVLPPCRWSGCAGIEFFHISERMTDDIVSWYTRDKAGNHATFMDLSTISPERVAIRHAEANHAIR